MLSFWLACILTRPLGASVGDWLASPGDRSDGRAERSRAGHLHHQPDLPRSHPGDGDLPDSDAPGRDRARRGGPCRTRHRLPAQGACRAGRLRTSRRRDHGPAALGPWPAAQRPGAGREQHLRRPDGLRARR
ncbi:hypothetical protein [Streptomyces sp. NPDC001108]